MKKHRLLSIVILIVLFALSCKPTNVLVYENCDNIFYNGSEKFNDFQRIEVTSECDSILSKFLSSRGGKRLYKNDTKPKHDLVNYYKCLYSKKRKKKYRNLIQDLEIYKYIFNEDGAILAYVDYNKSKEWGFYLMDYDFNLLHHSKNIYNFKNSNYTFAQEEGNLTYEIYNEDLGSYTATATPFQFRLINKKGEYLSDEKFFIPSYLRGGYYKVRRYFGGKYSPVKAGIMDSLRNIAIPLIYDDLEVRSHRGYSVLKASRIDEKNKTKCVLLSFNNEILVPPTNCGNINEDEYFENIIDKYLEENYLKGTILD